MEPNKANLSSEPNQGAILSVQVLRGLATLAVVTYHTHGILAQPEYGRIDVFGEIASKGWLGVNLFFIISGFIIMNAHAKDMGRPQAIPWYLWRRFTRLYPVYWVALTAFIVAAAIGLGHPDFRWDPRHLLSAYTLLHLVDSPSMPLKVAWTLLFEVKFYLLFLVVLLSRRIGLIVIVGWAVAVLIRNMFAPLPDWGQVAPDWGMLHIWNIYFAVGLGLWWALKRLEPGSGVLLLPAGVLLLVALCWNGADMKLTIDNPAMMVGLALALALILGGSILCEKLLGFEPPRALLLLGDASYSIYLVHSGVISLLAQTQAVFFFKKLPDEIVFAMILLIAMSAGIACHAVLEKPLLAMFRKLGPARSASTSRATASMNTVPQG